MTERCKWNHALSFYTLRALSKFDGCPIEYERSVIESESSLIELQRSSIELESSQTD